jgi:peptidyl-prolyl cis-trans isomerase C
MNLRLKDNPGLAALRAACLAMVMPTLFAGAAAGDEAPAGESGEQTRSAPSEIMGKPQTRRYSIGDLLFGSDSETADELQDAPADEPEVSADAPAPEEPAKTLPDADPRAEDRASPALPLAAATEPSEPDGEEPVISDALRELMEINPVVARVDGDEIRWVEVVASAGDLPLEDEEQVESLFPALLDRLIDLKLLAKAARRAALDEAEDIRTQVEIYEDNLIRERLLGDHLKDVVTEEAAHRRYEELVRASDSSQQIRARHILLPSEEQAWEVIERLDAGSDFAALARNRSVGPSASRGGELGYFDPGRMVPEFSVAALALEVGNYSVQPVRTAFGWHVIQLLDHRMCAKRRPRSLCGAFAVRLRWSFSPTRWSPGPRAAARKVRPTRKTDLASCAAAIDHTTFSCPTDALMPEGGNLPSRR